MSGGIRSDHNLSESSIILRKKLLRFLRKIWLRFERLNYEIIGVNIIGKGLVITLFKLELVLVVPYLKVANYL